MHTLLIGFLLVAVITITALSVPTSISKLVISSPAPNKFEVQEVSETQLSIPQTKLLSNNYHVFQTFNNCGPAALSMALSYYGINISQVTLGKELRPYQHPKGDNDDKSVTLEELARKAEDLDLVAFHRPAGDIETIKKFIASDLPVITRTLLHENEDIGHYRVVKGYDDRTKEFIQDDSLQGKNLRYSYTSFNNLWKTYNYEYLVLVPKNKVQVAESILGESVNPQKAWEKAASNARKEISQDNDIYAHLNLSVALYHLGEYNESIAEFEKVENELPFRTLWYQIEPIQSYRELKMNDRVLSLTQQILSNHNRAFSELYIIRGDIYKEQGALDEARREYELARQYNTNLPEASEALNSL